MLTLGATAAADPAALKRIFAKRPLLEEILTAHGSKTLQQFSQQNLSALPLPEENRKKEFIACVEDILKPRVGEEQAKSVSTQLHTHYAASSADHHSSLNSSLAISASTLIASGSEEWKNILVLSSASVSLNNEDYPRGVLFHGNGEDGSLNEQRLSLLPSNKHSSLVYGFRPYMLSEVEKVEKTLQQRVREKQMTAEQAERVKTIFTSIYRQPDITSHPTLCGQFTKVNTLLWKQYFRNTPKAPNLLYLELEELVSQLLVRHHLSEKTPMYHLLFDADAQTVLTALTNAMEEFVRQGQMNTYLFWGITEESHQRAKLSLQGQELVTDDGSIRIPFTPEAIAQALRGGRIMPNLLVIYTLVHLYYGFNCLGGFNQMQYLDSMKQVYNASGIDSLPSTANSRLYSYGLNLFFLEHAGVRTPAYGVDVLLHGTEDVWEQAMHMLNSLTVAEVFAANTHIIEELLYPPTV